MKRLVALLAASAVMLSAAVLAQPSDAPAGRQAQYGDDAAHGRFVEVNGMRLYVEEHGAGPALLLIHGNDGSIASLSRQIEAFSRHFRVIAVDSRDHGKSGPSPVPLSYELMADDFNALMEQLKLKTAHVLGWSDGGIIGLLLAMQHPDKVVKLAIAGAALNPEGAHEWAMTWALREREKITGMIRQEDGSQDWARALRLVDLLLKQPNIPPAALRRISAPTLVMSGDADIIRLEHTLEIFRHLQRAQLAIFPGSTHFTPLENAELFNATVLKFFLQPFERPDSKNYLK